MKRIFNLIFSCISLFISSCTHHEEEKEQESSFWVTSPIQRDTTIYKVYVGQINSSSHIELRSQEKGYLEKIFVDEGQFVQKGQLLFKIMPAIYQAEVDKAQAEMNYSEIEYRNTKSLAENNVVSSNELALVRAKLDKAKAELSLAQAHLAFTEIRAPFSGIIDRFHKRLGSLIDEGELLTSLSDNSKMWVYFNVPETEYLNYTKLVKSGNQQKVLLQLANKEMFDVYGVVETIEADFNNENGNIAFRATFLNPDRILRHGETGNILMPVSLKNAVIIPQKATFDILDKKYVYVVTAKNTVQTRQIEVSHELPHIYVVASGIGPNEKILAEGIGKVKNNDHIRYKLVSFDQQLMDLNKLHAE